MHSSCAIADAHSRKFAEQNFEFACYDSRTLSRYFYCKKRG